MPKHMTISEKILASKSSSNYVSPDEIIYCNVDIAMSHDNTALVIKNFQNIGIKNVWAPSKIVISLDHRIPANQIEIAEAHKNIRKFVKKQKIKNFFDLRQGICHQILPEHGFILPGELIIGTDSHSTTYGAFGAFGTGVGASEMAGIWATGEIWLKVPETIKITINGKLSKGVYAKDVILKIISEFTASGANYKTIEFYGETIKHFSISERMTLCNMTIEMGAKAGIVPPDKNTNNYLRNRSKKAFKNITSDKDAQFIKEITFDISKLEPQVAFPHAVDNVKDISEAAGIKINQAFVGSCTNGRLEDLKAVGDLLTGRTVHPDVRLLVCPASVDVYLNALKAGIIEKIILAGGVILNPGCGPCLGAHQGVLAAGEVAISSSNRNFRGRMGSPEAEVYLASPATVTASAIKGEITNPKIMLSSKKGDN
jgi:homoaconitate hydratase family protein